MKIRMQSIDSATGEQATQDLEVKEISKEEIARIVGASFNEEGAEFPEPKEIWTTECLIKHGHAWAFVVKGSKMVYFKEALITGIIYES